MMNIQAYALVIDFLVTLAVGLAVILRSKRTGAGSLSILYLSISAWSVCILLYKNLKFQGGDREVLYSSLLAGIFLFSTLAATALLTFTLTKTNRGFLINPASLALLGVMPILTQVLFWTTPWRGIFFGEQIIHIIFTATLWGKVNTLYLLCLVGASVLFSLDHFLQRLSLQRSQFGIIFISSLFPLIVLSLALLGISPFTDLVCPPLGFTAAAMGMTYALFDRRSGRVSAGEFNRETVVEGMDDGWMVLDPENNIVDMNPAAGRITGLVRDVVIGQPIGSVLGDLPNLGQTFNGSQDLDVKRSVKSEEGWRYLNIRSSALMDRDHQQFGRLIVWRDITDGKLANDARQRARDEMFVLTTEISSAASSTLNLDDFLLESIYHIIYPFRSQVVGIFLLDERTKKGEQPRLFLASHFGFPADAVNDLSLISSDSPIFDWAYKNRQPIQIDEAGDDRLPMVIRDMDLACLVIIPLITQAGDESKIIGFISLGRKEKPVFSQDEIVRLTTISDQIASLIDSDRRRKVAIALSERQRLMRDLHDSVSQKLYGLVTTTEAAQAALEAGQTVIPTEVLAKIGESARQAVKEMRLFLYQMQPIDVDKDGLISVLHHRLAAVEGRADIKARLLADDEIAISKDKEIALYYIAQEALNNVLRHAKAKSITVTLKQGRKNVILEIRDDGCGFDQKKVDRGGLGLRNIRERTSQVNGILKISSKPNEGTTIVVTVRKDPSVKPIKRRR